MIAVRMIGDFYLANVLAIRIFVCHAKQSMFLKAPVEACYVVFTGDEESFLKEYSEVLRGQDHAKILQQASEAAAVGENVSVGD